MSFEAIEFPVPDVVARMKERTLLQFRRAAVFQAVLAAFASELQALMTAIVDAQLLRTPSEATGEQLAALGRIVGMTKVVFDYGRLDWFTPDTEEYPPDLSMAWVTGAPIGVLTPIDDGLFKNLIEFKIFRNFTRFCSIPELETAILLAFGSRVAFEFDETDPMDVWLLALDETPHHIISFLTEPASNEQVDSVYYPPYAMTWRIKGVRSLNDRCLTNTSGEILEDGVTGAFLTP